MNCIFLCVEKFLLKKCFEMFQKCYFGRWENISNIKVIIIINQILDYSDILSVIDGRILIGLLSLIQFISFIYFIISSLAFFK